MDFLTNPHFWAGWVRIVIIDLLLAGDNALVIALAVRSLPPREQFWGRVFGTAGAVVLRLLFVAIVTFLLTVPLLRLVGGLLLVWIAVKLVRQDTGGPEHIRPGTTLKSAVGVIILADVVMSLDNVIAISAAARGDLVLVVFGLLLSLPLVVWGSGVLAKMMNRFPVVIWVGGGVLGWVAMKMITDDPFVVKWLGEWLSAAHHVGPYLLAGVITGIGWWFARGTVRAREETPHAS
ncbi:MAG: YjbE family putative metal transport protein [Chthoniobacteraceae bacterium]